MSAVEQQFAIKEVSRGARTVRVFKENFSCLSEILNCLDIHAQHDLVVVDDTRLTFAETKRRSGRLAGYLSSNHNIKAGDRVGLALPNSTEWIVSFIAITSLGAVPALINARASTEEIGHCLISTGCTLCLHARNDTPEDIPGLAMTDIAKIASADHAEDLPYTLRAGDDEALLMFTSGTTGLPKAASLSHESVLTSLKTIQYSSALIAEQMSAAYGIDYETLLQMRPPTVNLLIFPLFHVSGCHAVFLTSLVQGSKIVLLNKWDTHTALSLIEQEKVTAFPAVPTMYRDILNLTDRETYDLSSLTSLSVGGQATPPALLADIHAAFPNAILGTGYGMTESNGTVTLMVGESFINNSSSVGHLVSTLDAQIRDEGGAVLAINMSGEIFIRGAALMTRYANADEDPFDDDGWFSTGDIGYFDETGLLYIVDRKIDMVISGGENIYCAEVERAIDLHPAIRESAAFGLPDERLGEKVIAIAIPEPGQQITVEMLADHCLEHLARHKAPKEIYLQQAPLVRNASGKLVKRAIKATHLERPA